VRIVPPMPTTTIVTPNVQLSIIIYLLIIYGEMKNRNNLSSKDRQGSINAKNPEGVYIMGMSLQNRKVKLMMCSSG
jgi:hypothetical protein